MADNRINLIKAIDKPISFLVLILLMVEALLGGLVLKLEAYQNLLIITIIVFFAVYTIIIIIFAFLKPEALLGTRNWTERFSQPMAEDIYVSLDGYLSNLEEGEADEAWTQLIDILKESSADDKDFKLFSKAIGEKISRRVTIRRNIEERRGTIN